MNQIEGFAVPVGRIPAQIADATMTGIRDASTIMYLSLPTRSRELQSRYRGPWYV